MENTTIEDLVLKMQSGDDEAFALMVKQYEKLVFYIAMKSLRDPADAKDVMQETFLEVRKSIKNLKDPKLFKAWLNRIVFSKISRFYSKHKEITIDENTSSKLYQMHENRNYMIPEKAMHFKSNKDLLDTCIHQLKPIYREVILLRYFEQMSLLEIAEVLDIPEGTVKSRINVAKKELKKLILLLEDKEQVHITFESQTIESVLMAYFLESYAATKLPAFTSYMLSKNFFKKAMASNPVATLTICGSIFIGSIGIGAAILQHSATAKDTAVSEISHPVNDAIFPDFPETAYKDMQVKSARGAYTVLYKELIENENPKIIARKELQVLYSTLQSYGGHYATMAEMLMKKYNLRNMIDI